MHPIHFQKSELRRDKFSSIRSIPSEETTTGLAGLGDIGR